MNAAPEPEAPEVADLRVERARRLHERVCVPERCDSRFFGYFAPNTSGDDGDCVACHNEVGFVMRALAPAAEKYAHDGHHCIIDVRTGEMVWPPQA